MNIELRQKCKVNIEKDFWKQINNAVFGKSMENVRKHKDIKLIITKARRNYYVSEPNAQSYNKNFFG